jgi:hypothetical protein
MKESIKMKQTYVFIEVGRPIPRYLGDSIEFTRATNPRSQIAFVSEKVKNFGIPIEINHKFSPHIYSREINKIKDKFAKQVQHKGGYWLNSTLRLFALADFIRNNKEIKNLIHIESDALCFINEYAYAELTSKYKTPSIAVNSIGKCVPTCLIVGDTERYLHFVDYCSKLILEGLSEPDFFWSDQYLLAKGLEKGLIATLPSPTLKSLSESSVTEIMFDTAVAGGYLLGKDPAHNYFLQKSGYCYEVELKPIIKKSAWGLLEYKAYGKLPTFILEDKNFHFLTLHNYAKRRIKHFNSSREMWQQIFDEANGNAWRKFTIRIDILVDTIFFKLKQKF